MNAVPSRETVVSVNVSDWERHLVLHNDWRVFVRPIRPHDEAAVKMLLKHVTIDDLRLRFFTAIKDFSHVFLARLTHLDYAHAMAFIAFDEITHEPLGVVRIHSDTAHITGEYAILLRSDLKGHGLGWALMESIIAYAKAVGLKQICGQVLQRNAVMIKMCREFGFTVQFDPQDRSLCDVTLDLTTNAD